MENKRFLIFVFNDDGIMVKGISELIKFFCLLGEIVVMVLDVFCFGSGCVLMVIQLVYYQLLKKDVGLIVYKCFGILIDCIKLVWNQIFDWKLDLVVGGINYGDNFVINVYYFGMMGIVIEGCFNGIFFIGFFICDYVFGVDFDVVGFYVWRIVVMVFEKGFLLLICFNVNFFNIQEIKGVRICEQVKGYWSGEWQVCFWRDDVNFYWLIGEFIDYELENEKNDYWVLVNGYVVIIFIVVDMIVYYFMDELKFWEL